jgi:nucleoside triphosphatase
MAGKRYPEPCVGGLIFNGEGKFLLIKSPKWHGEYITPGGHVEVGETIKEAMRREAKEETGLDVEVGELIIVMDATKPVEFWKPKDFIFIDFACEMKGGELRLDGREATDFVWVTPEEALKMEALNRFARRIIEEYLRKKRKP